MLSSKHIALVAALLFVMLGATVPPQAVFSQAVLPWEERSKDDSIAASPLLFTPNNGRYSDQVQFQADALGGSIFFTSREVVFAVPTPEADPTRWLSPLEEEVIDITPREFNVIRVSHQGAQRNLTIKGITQHASSTNFLNSSDSRLWKVGIPSFGAISYENLYPGITLYYDGSQGSLKSYYSVRPGANPADIVWDYKGVSSMSLDADGNLILTVKSKENYTANLLDEAPIAWQIIDGQKTIVDVAYDIQQNNKVRFTLGSYNPAYELIVDPTITYSSFLGGTSSSNASGGIARDVNGNLYVTGTTSSTDFPGSGTIVPFINGVSNVYVAKYSPDGRTLVYRTFLGVVSVRDIDVDSSGQVYITGVTTGTIQPPIVNAYQSQNNGGLDAYLLKLNSSGNGVLFSTFLGGSSNDSPYGLDVQSNGATIAVAGYTRSSNFPVFNAYDATANVPPHHSLGNGFVAKFTSAGSLAYSTYFSSGGVNFVVQDVAVNANGEAIFVGNATCPAIVNGYPNSPTSGGKYYARLSASGTTLLNCAHLGSMGNARGIDLDSANNIYITGETSPSGFPLVNAAISTPLSTSGIAFLTKLTAAGNSIVYSTYLGGGLDSVGSIAVSPAGIATVAGNTYAYATSTFPERREAQSLRNGAAQVTGGLEPKDGIIIQVNPNGTIAYSTFIGGNGVDFVSGVAINNVGEVYAVGSTSDANTSDGQPMQGFPLVAAQHSTYSGSEQGFIMTLHPEGYRIPGENIAQYDITATPRGQTAIADTLTTYQQEGAFSSMSASDFVAYNFGSNNVDEILVTTHAGYGVVPLEVISTWGANGKHNIDFTLGMDHPGAGSTSQISTLQADVDWVIVGNLPLSFVSEMKPNNVFQKYGKLELSGATKFYQLFNEADPLNDYTSVLAWATGQVEGGAGIRKLTYTKRRTPYDSALAFMPFPNPSGPDPFPVNIVDRDPLGDYSGPCQTQTITITTPGGFRGFGAEAPATFQFCESVIVNYAPISLQWINANNAYLRQTNPPIRPLRSVAHGYVLSTPEGQSYFPSFWFYTRLEADAVNYDN